MSDAPTPLALHIARLIEETGPITVSQFMGAALGHPDHGYYVTRDPLGAKGDFITAPEVSQMFGELIGLWLADCWMRQRTDTGTPSPFRLVELGPGRGTLMADALRAMKSVPGMAAAAHVHFVETSPALRAEQEARVPDASWHDRFADVPEGPTFLIANEFFDALPVRQFVKTAQGWCERHVALADGAGAEAPRFAFALSPVPLKDESAIPQGARGAPEGSIAELSPASTAIAQEIAARIADQGGAALIIDYGHARSAAGDTLQAMRGHGFADPLENPGEADITAHVDFETIAAAAKAGGCATFGPVEQGRFLAELGIQARAEALARTASPDQIRDIGTALQRLTAPDQMGSLFKVLGLLPAGAEPPAGFTGS
ncbi:NADH dehydrogenase [ubiquinone] 1 alpha subcomplex assembly factor 7 [Parvibaculum indicum]|uniref:class I SAM-dependent methyltransferase n=1 Tax=Parvibaculum indicum TaxID=562969 RepID=UPI00141F9A2A|nr:SAM-dependent methyltransferase [Parvibaculum indicum]NIJ40254.1 NADH dehydrogenase [ubiquinone] 1 alpha subcomplex assembly factor 7 [Parvibaculum indicum]